jgi:putative ABC transport system substrate-binding protein
MKIALKGIGLFSLKSVKISLVLLFLLPSSSYGRDYTIAIIPSSDSNTYITTANHIKSTIKKTNNNLIIINTIKIKDLSYHKKATLKDVDLFVPIGQRALKEVLKYSGNIPVLVSLISRYDFNRVIGNKKHYENNIGAIYIDQPLNRHTSFSELVLPDSNRFSFIISENNKHAINKLDLLEHDNYRISILKQGGNVLSTLSSALKDSDALIAVPDPIIFNLRTTRSILLSTYRKRVPLIGFSESYVKAGALAALYSTPELIGKQTGEVISLFINRASSDSDPFFLPRLHAKYFSISVNKKVARSLGLTVPDVDSLEESLLKIEKNR